MKIILQAYDFLKSWRYYPTMKKYLEEKCCAKCPRSRLGYALWHCKNGILLDVGIENLSTTLKDVSDGWERVYRKNPIKKE